MTGTPESNLAADPQAPTGLPPSFVDRVPETMKAWREAILTKNAVSVERIDRAFAEEARLFTPALMASAETDPEERVRSFSTRVLGKLRPAESVALMRRLLEDRSPYVRFNAAWALGELADRDATPRLRQLERRDPSPIVRHSAEASRLKIEGG